LKGFFKWYDGGEEDGITSKGFLKLKYFSPLRILTSPLFEESLRAFISLPLFFFALSHEDMGVLMIFEEKNHFFKNFFSNGFNILAVDAYSGGGCMIVEMGELWIYIGSGRIFCSGVMHADIF
jgi:hypothetical protein